MISLFAGCYFISEEEHRARLQEGPTGVDSGDAEETGDTGGAEAGRLTGTFSMTVEGAASPSDSCSGEVVVDVGRDTLLGSFVCRFESAVDVYADQGGRIEGDREGGDVVFTSDFDTTTPWTGGLSGGDAPVLNGFFTVTDVAFGLDRLQGEGYFSATR